MRPKKFYNPNMITVNGTNFILLPPEGTSHCVGISSNQIVKIENFPHANKLRTLVEEAEVIQYLNSKGCKSCPFLVACGQLEDGRPYLVEQRIIPRGKAVLGEILLAVFEQKLLGVYQGDLHPRNIIFDGNKTYLIDYDQAIMDESIINMEDAEFLYWISEQKIPAYVFENQDLQNSYLEYVHLISHLPGYL
ncbi:MAG: hypothetical protein ACOX6E_00795 [Syntrophomonadaceae bacterium]|jgi:predicted Ser/Thr protein kinase